MGKVIIYGYTQNFAVDVKIQVYANGKLMGEVSKNDKLEFDIETDTNIEFKASFRKASIMAYKDRTNEIKIVWNRLTGAIQPQVVSENASSAVYTSSSTEKLENKNVYEAYNGQKTLNKIAYCLLAFFLGGLGIHKFYAGKVGLGIVYLLFCWTAIPGIIAFIEMIIALTKESDSNGNILI